MARHLSALLQLNVMFLELLKQGTALPTKESFSTFSGSQYVESMILYIYSDVIFETSSSVRL